jgi:hypothetical protein
VQIITIYESDAKARTDEFYVSSFIKYHYRSSLRYVQLTPLFLGGIGNYKAKEVLTLIERAKNTYALLGGETYVVYFFDVDQVNSAAEKRRKRLISYLNKRGYLQAWFSLDVEDVFLGRQVKDEEKVKEARRFLANGLVSCLPLEALRVANPRGHHESDLLLVLDPLLKDYRED